MKFEDFVQIPLDEPAAMSFQLCSMTIERHIWLIAFFVARLVVRLVRYMTIPTICLRNFDNNNNNKTN